MINFDELRVKEVFAGYTKNYNPEDPKIALKIDHTYRVSEICREIATSIVGNIADPEAVDFIELAWLSGMLHDIGRFEQVRIYNTFMDIESVDHAEFGADILFKDNKMIKEFLDTREWDNILEIAIRNHNKFRVCDGLDERTLSICNILRDADKVDILRVNVETPFTDIYNTTEEILYNSSVSPEVLAQIRNHQTVTREVRKTPVDHLMGHIALMFELVYPKSREIAKRQGYLEKLFAFQTRNPQTREALEIARYELAKEWDI